MTRALEAGDSRPGYSTPIGLIAPTIKAVQEVEARRQLDYAELKAANDNLVSETSVLKKQLQAANDNYVELKREVDALKRVRR